jgi:hypothetical protein
MTIHPLAEIVPPMTAPEFEALVNDMREHGFDPRFPIVLLDGRVIDGRHRFKAATEAGVEPVFVNYSIEEFGDPAVFVLRAASRRNLTQSQRAALATEMLPHLRAEAEKREKAGKSDPPEKVPEGREQRESTTIAAKSAGTNRKYVEVAEKAKSHAPEVFDAMKAGTISVPEAKRRLAPKSPPPPAEPEATDGLGRTTTEPPVVAALGQRDKFAALKREIEAVIASAKALAASDVGACLRLGTIETALRNAAAAVRFAAPYCACPMNPRQCERGCKVCGGRRWIVKEVYDRLPEEQKQ